MNEANNSRALIADHKREIRATLAQKKKEQRAHERRCFWTWPLGHQWQNVERIGPYYIDRCLICGKRTAWRVP